MSETTTMPTTRPRGIDVNDWARWMYRLQGEKFREFSAEPPMRPGSGRRPLFLLEWQRGIHLCADCPAVPLWATVEALYRVLDDVHDFPTKYDPDVPAVAKKVRRLLNEQRYSQLKAALDDWNMMRPDDLPVTLDRRTVETLQKMLAEHRWDDARKLLADHAQPLR